MWGLGGKYGDRITRTLNAPSENSIEYIQSLTLEQLKEKLDHSDAQHVYHLVRGEESTEIITRTEIKSMQSIKNFSSKGLKTFDDCKQWMKVFAADLANRVLDLDHDYDIPPRPKKVSLSYNHYTGHGKQSKSKIGSFPDMFAKDIPFQKLSSIILDAGCQLIKQLEADAASNSETIYPCNLLNLTVTGIEKIGPEKGSKSLENFFAPKKPDGSKQVEQDEQDEQDESERMEVDEADRIEIKDDSDEELFVGDSPVKSIRLFTCERCNKRIPLEGKSEHGDWHFAKELQDNQQPTTSRTVKRSAESSSVKTPPAKKKTTSHTSSKKSSGQQSLLKFFRSS
jgi:DNA polymerase eta